MTYYNAHGQVRGSCPHRHRTPAGAEKCAARDRRDCAALGGGAYSDRLVYEVNDDGDRVTLARVVTG